MPCNNHMFAEIDAILIDMTCYKFHTNFGLYFDELESILNEMANTHYNNSEILYVISMYHAYLKTLEKYKSE